MTVTHHGIEFNIIKTDYDWKAETKQYHILAQRGKTRKACIKALEAACSKVTKAELHDMVEYARQAKIKKRLWNRGCIQTTFHILFKFPLNQVNDIFLASVCNTRGIDPIRLDKMIHTPDGISTKEWIREKYGYKAVRLVEKLM